MTRANTKQMKQAYKAYRMNWYDGVTLRDVYGRHSDAKERAYEYCLRLMDEYHGRGGVILSHNQMIFTFAFIGMNPETGEAAFFYITPTYDRYANITDLE